MMVRGANRVSSKILKGLLIMSDSNSAPIEPNQMSDEPQGELTLRTLAMPADANAAGDIFGGWVMAQMDLACGIRAAERANGRVVTAAVKEMSFVAPVKIGDTLCIYTSVTRVGRTSIALRVEAWAQRYLKAGNRDLVTHADFVMVALDAEGHPTPVAA
jgi:acyl-CoA thioesterase YciA